MAKPDVTLRESFLLQADTLASARAHLVELAERLDQAEPLDRARALLLVAALTDRAMDCVRDVTSLLPRQ